MNSNKLLRFAEIFYSLAAKEQLPDNTTNFNKFIKNLESLETFGARKKYTENNLKRLSSGSSRIVYLTDQNTVLKLAKNEKGLEQNKTESNPKMKSKHLNKILDKSPKYLWIVVPFLNKITEKQFKKLTDISFNDFSAAIKYGLKSISNSDKKKPNNFDEICKDKFYKEIFELGKKFKLLPGDLAKISSYGEKDDQIILIDAGLTQEIYEEFYES